MNTLPNDIARCDGADFPECRGCLRRIATRPERVWMIAPDKTDGECKYHIPSDEKPLPHKG
jgi:hypothetical protein